VREWPIKHALIALGALGVSPKIGATRPVDFFVLLLLKHLHMTTRACLMTLTLPINVWVNVVLIIYLLFSSKVDYQRNEKYLKATAFENESTGLATLYLFRVISWQL
jgi:hypothetical protein